MSDLISLVGIDVYAHHGVHPAERELGQRFIINADLYLDCSAAAMSDSLEQALDYSVVHRRILELAGAESFHLIEALAHYLCVGLLKEFPLDKVVLTVHKPNPPLPDFRGSVSVTLERDKTWFDNLSAGHP
ncbi:MAG: dihydroneopterin aldolase [Gemmatimonadales bacterium]|nr:dihydroneopterin aldolase [Gemmatimonadales bacterium]